MNEIFPIACGLVAGVAFGGFAPRLRLVLGTVAAVVLGTVATLISGEYLISWGFLLIDIPLVAVSAVVGLLASRAVRVRVTGESIHRA